MYIFNMIKPKTAWIPDIGNKILFLVSFLISNAPGAND